MGGFSDNYECGYWGDDTPPIKRNDKVKNHKSNDLDVNKRYVERKDAKYRYLNFILTESSLLRDDEQEERTNLTQLCNVETDLELRSNDANSLDIYYDDVFIGGVQKVFEADNIDNTQIVNDFCFGDDGLNDVEAFWDGDVFYLRVAVK